MSSRTQINFSAIVNITSPFCTVTTTRKMETKVENNDEKIQKFGAHSVASKITEELIKQKINRKG